MNMPLILPNRYKQTKDKIIGGMGNVIICNDENLDRKVAIKCIQNIKDLPRLLDEIKALQTIRSKHVVELYDIIIDRNKQIGIVQDYLPGNDLTSIKRPLSKEEYLKILYQISSGISDIHCAGVIHRDIKPNNMKYDQENYIKIFDFGLARLAGLDAKTKGFKGTLGFAAPELFQEGNFTFTEAIDVYAFGVMAWVIAEGNVPIGYFPEDWRHSTSSDNVTKHLLIEFDKLSIAIPNEIKDVLKQSLLTKPKERPTIHNLRDIISKHLLYGKHSALVISDGNEYRIETVNQIIDLNIPEIGKLQIKYDGLSFIIISFEGEVYINNSKPKQNDILPCSCVITFGDQWRKASRRYITFDVSHPEVVL